MQVSCVEPSCHQSRYWRCLDGRQAENYVNVCSNNKMQLNILICQQTGHVFAPYVVWKGKAKRPSGFEAAFFSPTPGLSFLSKMCFFTNLSSREKCATNCTLLEVQKKHLNRLHSNANAHSQCLFHTFVSCVHLISVFLILNAGV